MTSGLSLAKKYTIAHDTEIDLNGNAISSNLTTTLFEVSGAKLTLKGGEIDAKKWIVTATNGGEVVIQNGTYVSQNESFKAIGAGSKITMNGGTVRTNECALGANQGGLIELNGGLVETADNMGIGTNGSAGQGGNRIVINGGVIDASIKSNGYEAIGVYIANNDEFVMNGGEIIAHGGTGLCMRSGMVTINDGTITATNTRKDGTVVADGKIGDDATIMTGCSAIIYHESANYPGKEGMNLHVNGGIITGVDHAIQVLSNEAEPQVFVTGGTFTPAYPEVEPNT